MKNFKTLVIVTLVMGLIFTGCGKKEGEAPVKKVDMTLFETEGSTFEPIDYNFIKGKTYSQLTGELISDKVAKNRIVTCVINNIDRAMPQSGLSQADIMYECVVEGGITRLMGVFQDYKKIKKLGPVRSARHYYVDYSTEYKAVYAHFGQTKYAVREMKKMKTEELSGLSALGYKVFYRDNSRVAPHNAYTDGEKICLGIKEAKFKNTNKLKEDRFDFNYEVEELNADNAKKCNYIDLKYNSYSHPHFEYIDGRYYRWQYNTKHIDDITGEQLSYENVIIQFAKYSNIDRNGYQDVDLIGEGKGYYCTEGKYIPITWAKTGKKSFTNFFTEDGKDLKVNPGNTFISVFPTRDKKNISFKKPE